MLPGSNISLSRAQDDNAFSEAAGFRRSTGGSGGAPVVLKKTLTSDDGVNHTEAEKYLDAVRPRHLGEQPEADDAPLTEEQLAQYRARLESGFYRSDAVIHQVAGRVSDELFPPEID